MRTVKTTTPTLTTTLTHKNYFPYLMTGYSKSVPLPERERLYNSWTAIAWKVIQEYARGVILIMVAFYEQNMVTGRASVMYDTTTGEILKYTYQSKSGFSPENVFKLQEMNVEYHVIGEAKNYVRNLISYFKEINDLEYENALLKREIRNSIGFAADQFDKDKNAHKTPYQYAEPDCDPTSPKAPVYVGPKTKRNPYNLVTKSWERKGYYRRYKNGRVVYIPPTTIYRKCK